MSGFDDFDFLIGDWTVTNERLRERLVGSSEWETFTAFSRVEKVMQAPTAPLAAISTRWPCPSTVSPA